MLSFLQIALIMDSLAREPHKDCPLGSADTGLAEWPRLCWPEVDGLNPHPQLGFWHLTSLLGVTSTATKRDKLRAVNRRATRAPGARLARTASCHWGEDPGDQGGSSVPPVPQIFPPL